MGLSRVERQSMQILQVIEYNNRQSVKYHEACQAWEPNEGGFPQAAFYFMSNARGDYRKTGFVLHNNKGSY